MRVDLIAERMQFGRVRRYAIEVKDWRQPVNASEIGKFVNYARTSRDRGEIDEFWLIGRSFTADARRSAMRERGVMLFTFDEFDNVLVFEGQSAGGSRRAPRTKIGKAIRANGSQITVLTGSLLLLIEARLTALRDERPNHPDDIAARDELIAQYERMQRELNELRQAIEEFQKGAIKETVVVKTTKSFADGVRDWWNKSNQTICTKAYDMGLFASAVGICSVAGAGGKMSVLVSAALVGGKHVGSALKGLTKHITG
jgi:hypothetical protein